MIFPYAGDDCHLAASCTFTNTGRRGESINRTFNIYSTL